MPASFRQALATQPFQGIAAFRSYKGDAIEACALSRMERLSESVDTLDMFSEEHDDMSSILFADAHQLAFDSEGRIMLPDELREHAGITTTACFVGRGATFQIWNPDTFKIHQEEARVRLRERGATLRLSKETPPKGEN